MSISKYHHETNRPVRHLAKLLLFVFACGMVSAAASANEPFYWKDSYGRGVGTVVTAHCGSGKHLEAGLCYTSCDPGFTGIGPVCTNGNPLQTQQRGIGTVPAYNCGSNEEQAGLCYESCRHGYKGSGPVCWQTPPTGYIDCGAGFAESSTACGLITTGQVVSAAAALAPLLSAAKKAEEAAQLAKLSSADAEEVSALAQRLGPILDKLKPIFENIANKGDDIATKLNSLAPEVRAYIAAHPDDVTLAVRIFKIIKGEASYQIQLAQGPDQWIDFVRIAFTVTGMLDPTPVSGLISAYAYPVLPPYPYTASSASGVVRDPANLYIVNSAGDLMFYRQNSDGTFANWYAKKIGSGWGGFQWLQAVRIPGVGGGLYGVLPNGDLLYYQHDMNGNFTISGKKIGNGWTTGIKYFMAARKGLLYVVKDNGDLVEYDHDDNFTFTNVKTIGYGWLGFKRLFSGGYGALFGINDDGLLHYYYYNGSSFTVANKIIGNGWNFPYVSASGDGNIYSVAENGDLLIYRLAAATNEFVNSGLPVPIGNTWGNPGKYGLIVGQY